MVRAKTFASKKEFAYASLREEILAGGLAPGQRLVIDDLAGELGVSPIPIREALQQLQNDGLVIIEPFVGARVTEIHAGLITEIFEVLAALETISGQSACLRMSADDFSELEDLLREMDACVDDVERWSAYNINLHQFICDKAGMHLVRDLMLRVLDHWQRLRRFYLEGVSGRRLATAQQEHWIMYDALVLRNPERVALCIREHNERALAAYLAYLPATGQIKGSEFLE